MGHQLSPKSSSPTQTGAAPPEFNLGGQALIEGVMMRSPHFIAAAVRRQDGSIETRLEQFNSITAKSKILRLPLLRGVVALIEMMSVGMRFLNWSAQLALVPPSEPTAAVAPAGAPPPENDAALPAATRAEPVATNAAPP